MVPILKGIIASALVLVVGFYFAVVSTDAGRTGVWNFWPQPFLVFVPAVVVALALLYASLHFEWWTAQRRARQHADGKAITHAATSTADRLRDRLNAVQRVTRASEALYPPEQPPGYELKDVETRFRVSDQRYAVSYGGPPIGTITPHKGLFEAWHIRAGELGTYSTLEAAKEAVWAADA